MLNNSCKSAGTLVLLVLVARTTLALDFNVPADLRSAGIEYKDLLIRLKYRCIIKVNNDKFNAMFALKV